MVIMRAGASALVVSYSTLAEDLASHGYVVVGFDAPYRTFDVAFPDGRVMSRPPENDPELCEDQPPARQARCVSRFLTAWTADVAFVLDRLERLNASGSGYTDASRCVRNEWKTTGCIASPTLFLQRLLLPLIAPWMLGAES